MFQKTKPEVMSEIAEFLRGALESIHRIYADALPLPEPEELQVEKTHLWSTLSAMYDYGVMGQRVDGVHWDAETLDGNFADVEMFLAGLAGLEEFLNEDNVAIPTWSLRVARMAVARHVLDGGMRWSFLEEDPGLPVFQQFLTFSELALLANMDERSVRNAANPKLTDPLKTLAGQRRTVIAVEEARRWLTGRRGFIPTESTTAPAAAPAVADHALSSAALAALSAAAAHAGLPLEQFVLERLASLPNKP